MDENSRAKEGGRNLVPRVVSYLSPSRSKGRVGRNSGNEVGREEENGRDFAPLFSHASLRFVTSHSCVSCPRKTRRLRRGRERSLPSLFCPHSQHFFSLSGKFFWTTDFSLQSSGCKNLNHRGVHGVGNRIISSCLAQLILAS